MGQTLSEPVTEKHTSSGSNRRIKYALSEMQGWRVSMEDAHTSELEFEEEKNTSFFGVYDGHGGINVARYSGANCHKRIIKDPEFQKGNYREALKNGFLGMDHDLHDDPNYLNETSGCTSVVLLVSKDNHLYCANAGDSRCVLSSAGAAIPLSFDHKPTNESEMSRIYDAGGFVQFGRVNANLALSRAFGDFEFKKNDSLPPEKQIVTADPEIIDRAIHPDDEFVILACDGIWDVMSNQQIVSFVRSKIAQGHSLETICEMVLDKCLAQDPSNAIGCDNMTIIIAALLMGETEEDWKKKCCKKVIVDGEEIDPMQNEEEKAETDLVVCEDPEEKFHF